MNYVQALWRGVDQERDENAGTVESSDPHFGRLTFFDRYDREGHWEALLSHPRSGARYTVILPGDRDVPFQPYADFHRRMVGDPDVFLRQCSSELCRAHETVTGRALSASYLRSFVLEGVTLPIRAEEEGSWTACFHAPGIDVHFTVHLSGAQIREVQHGSAFDFCA